MEPTRIVVAGATGYLGTHVVKELVARGHQVVALARRRAGVGGRLSEDDVRAALPGATVRFAEVTEPASLASHGFAGEHFHAVVSCLASRSGAPEDAWRIDHQANLNLLEAARAAGVQHFVLLSAICVQKPLLAFQHAKLAFERALIASGLTYSIVRPTAFFKSLAGQVDRVKRGRPFTVLGDGSLTACLPISERDVADFIASCLEEPGLKNAILPVGGPGPAVTPREQGALLFELLGKPPRYRSVPVGVLDAIIGTLAALGRLVPGLASKAELARIGRYYGTESMLVWDAHHGRYDADATPRHGRDTLREFYARALADGLAGQELGDQAVFSRDEGGAR